MYNVLVSAHTIKLIERAIKRLFCAMKVPAQQNWVTNECNFGAGIE